MAVLAVATMCIAALAGFFAGALVNDPMGGAVLLALIAGMGWVVHAIERTRRDR